MAHALVLVGVEYFPERRKLSDPVLAQQSGQLFLQGLQTGKLRTALSPPLLCLNGLPDKVRCLNDLLGHPGNAVGLGDVDLLGCSGFNFLIVCDLAVDFQLHLSAAADEFDCKWVLLRIILYFFFQYGDALTEPLLVVFEGGQ
jgi:hypothetical protein